MTSGRAAKEAVDRAFACAKATADKEGDRSLNGALNRHAFARRPASPPPPGLSSLYDLRHMTKVGRRAPTPRLTLITLETLTLPHEMLGLKL